MINFKSFLTEIKITLKYHDKLNPLIWNNGSLSDKTRNYLLENAYKFAKFSGVKNNEIQDIVFTGSSANFNYTKYSDVDVHILIKRNNIDTDFLYNKKKKWTDNHKELKLHNYPVEYYVQDYHEHFPNGQGVFSLLKNEWLVKPKHLKDVKVLKDPKTLIKIEYNIKEIKNLIKNGTSNEIEKYKEKLRKMRETGLHKQGEFSIENVIYKDLRNRGLLDNLNDALKKIKK